MLKIIATAKTKNKIYASAKVDGKIEASVRFPSIIVPQKSGIAYPPKGWSGQTISYRKNDEGWRWQNGDFERVSPSNPLYAQSLDFSSGTLRKLKYPNIFGTFERYTDLDGGQYWTNTERTFIDHYYGCIIHDRIYPIIFENIFSDIDTYTYQGITGWQVVSLTEYQRLFTPIAGVGLSGPNWINLGPIGYDNPTIVTGVNAQFTLRTSFYRADWWIRGLPRGDFQSSGIGN